LEPCRVLDQLAEIPEYIKFYRSIITTSTVNDQTLINCKK
jgi:hypothetical protein